MLAALRDTAAAVIESSPTQAQHTLVVSVCVCVVVSLTMSLQSLQSLLTSIPLTPPTITTLLATVETALNICSSVNALTELSDSLASLFKTAYSQLKVLCHRVIGHRVNLSIYRVLWA